MPAAKKTTKQKIKRLSTEVDDGKNRTSLKRLQSGVPGLDTITGGGFLIGGTYLLIGSPGAGKTILANQIAFNDAKKHRALYVTLLAESHSRMFAHLDTLDFFDRSKISSEVQYLSGYDVLEKEGVNGLMRMLASAVVRQKAQVLIIDGIASASEISEGASFKKFVHNLSSVIGMSSCTTFLLSSVHHDRSAPEYTMVDGIISLTIREVEMRSAREIEVQKFRGSQHYYGKHFFEIAPNGISVYPRVDGVYGAEREPDARPSGRAKTGIESLDSKLEGGLTRNSTTTLLGPSGAGKTSVGMSFLRAGAEAGEHGVLLSLYEHPLLLERKLKRIGLDISALVKDGSLSVLRQEPTGFIMDKLIYHLMAHLEKTRAKRLFIDGLEGFKDSGYLGNERIYSILSALAAELRYRKITTVMVEETDTGSPNVKGSNLLSFDSGIFDNIIQFSYAHFEKSRVNVLNILKTRESDHKSEFYHLELTKNGPKLGQTFSFVKPLYPEVRTTQD